MSVIEKLDSVLEILNNSDADVDEMFDAAKDILRDHGPAIRQAMIDAERWRKARKELLWAPSYDGCVRWSIELKMPEPDMGNPGASLDAAIDARLASDSATGEGEGHD